MGRLMVVDDEPAINWSLTQALTDEGHRVATAASAEEALRLCEQGERPQAMLLDVRLPGLDGLSALPRFQAYLGSAPIIVMTAFGNLTTAVRAMELGAYDYLIKPFDLDAAVRIVQSALTVTKESAGTHETAAPVDAELDPGRRSPDGAAAGGATVVVRPGELIGQTPLWQQVFKQIALVSPSDVSVLITGESGTGKELVARAIHQYSARRDRIFFPVSIPALNPGLIESELFGHVRGAFTGAQEQRTGLLELAAGGTVLLDEVGDIPPAVQVKLLRALEQREILPVGDHRGRQLDLRLLAATNRSLQEMIQSGAFREDLFYRLSGFQIHLPPLRERREDIPLLAEHFLRSIARRGLDRSPGLSRAALAELQQRDWPGNVRELRNVIEHASILARGGMIQVDQLPPPGQARLPVESVDDQIRQALSVWVDQRLGTDLANGSATAAPESLDLYERFLELAEEPLFRRLLERCGQNRALAAQILGMHRTTLRQKLRRYGWP